MLSGGERNRLNLARVHALLWNSLTCPARGACISLLHVPSAQVAGFMAL